MATRFAIFLASFGLLALAGPSLGLAAAPSPLVRACFARILRGLFWADRSAPLLVIALNHEVGDRVSLESIGIGARGHEEGTGFVLSSGGLEQHGGCITFEFPCAAQQPSSRTVRNR